MPVSLGGRVQNRELMKKSGQKHPVKMSDFTCSPVLPGVLLEAKALLSFAKTHGG